MASWIVHLRIAENLLNQFHNYSSSQFAVGNIAPDSGLPDEKWEKFNPPTEITHFQTSGEKNPPCNDMVFYNKYLVSESLRQSDNERISFLWGYYCHLVTDNLWRIIIAQPTIERYKERFDANPDFIWEVKKDWYGLDFVYVRSHPKSIYWNLFLKCNYPINYLDFLLSEGVRQRIEYIKDFYQKSDPEIEEMVTKERIYLTEYEMDKFVSDSTIKLSKGINKLMEKSSEIEGIQSILEVNL